jgi:hypothetical protein
VLVAELIHLEFDQNVAFEDAVVEDQIHKAARVSDDDALLLRFQTKAMAKFQYDFTSGDDSYELRGDQPTLKVSDGHSFKATIAQHHPF